ncbi:MAG: hypothetical protein A2X57_08855 [Nitrospirae bacterium GWD2_57_8]|nr:MAG: hypothetical protein A2X57_08855 [Nitrospirae bacterium GWD2_57_8]
MSIIVLLDILSVIAFGAAFFYGLGIRTTLWAGPARLFFTLSMGLYVLVALSKVLEHSGITPSYDAYEDHAEILFLPLFLFFLFSIRARQELNIRGQAEEEMRKAVSRAWEEKEKFEAMISAVGDGIAILDRDLRVLYENHVHRMMMGDHVSEFCYRAYQKREAPCEECPVALAYLDGKIHTVEKVVSKDGQTLYLEITASPLRDSRGAVVGGVEVVRDVTVRRQAEAEIRESAERCRDLFENANDAIFIVDTDLRYKAVNRKAAEVLGYSIEELLTMSVLDIIPQDQVSRSEEEFQKLGKTGAYEQFVGKVRKRDGRCIDVEVNSSAIIKDGAVVGSRDIMRDITDRRKGEEALRQSEERYRMLFENNPHPMWVYDLETLAFLAVNTAAIRHYGYSREEFLARTIKDIRPPEDVPALLGNIAQVTEGIDEAGTWRHRTKDGRIIDVEITSHVLVFDGRRAELVLAHDVTERRRMEEELLKAQKLESLCILAGGLAHDFNNLLTAILGNISLAQMYSDGDAQIAERLQEAERASLRARDLTYQLLTFSRGGEPVKKAVVLGPLIKEAADFALRGSRSRCEFDLPEDLWTAEVDEGQISQVMNNLVINADQAMPGGGLVTVSGSNRTVGDTEIPNLSAGDYVRITVADRGIGIPHQHLKKIFDPYFTTKQKGSGLGLATSYSILHRHGGHIRVTSDVGKGTAFTFYLPAADRATASKPQQPNALVRGQGRILVMDDEAMVRDVAGKMLAGLGYEVEIAKDGEEALSVYEAAMTEGMPFAAVIMDLTIPGGMGGKEAVERLKSRDPAAKVIVSSGYSNDPVITEYRAYGFDAVVAKPYTVKNLSEAVARELSREKT